MKKICLFSFSFIFVFFFSFFFFSSFSWAQYAACDSFEGCGSHGCPGGGTTGYECCPSCGSAVICHDMGFGCPGDQTSCTYGCYPNNPYCPPPNCATMSCINGSCVSECSPGNCDNPTPAPTGGGTPAPTGGGTPTPTPNPAAAPTCTITGPTTVQINQPVGFFATTTLPAGNPAHTRIAYNTSLSVSGGIQIDYSTCGNSTNSCVVTALWTPTAVGTYYVYCQGENDSSTYCQPFSPYTATVTDCNGVPNTCTGSGSDCLPVVVTTVSPWLQSRGGDVHGNTSVGTIIPSTATTGLFSLDPAGIVSTGNGFFGGNIDGAAMSTPKWQVANSSENIIGFGVNQSKYDYSFFYKKLGSPTVNNFSGVLPSAP